MFCQALSDKFLGTAEILPQNTSILSRIPLRDNLCVKHYDRLIRHHNLADPPTL